MSHTFQASDEQYDYLLAYTKGVGETPETFFQYWVEGMIDRMEARRRWEEEQAQKSHEEGSPDLLLKGPKVGIEVSTSKKEPER